MWIIKLLPKRVLSLQARKPSGMIGRFVMTKVFNSGNADLNAFVMECLSLKPKDQVFEIGFGPGKLIHEMANIVTEGRVEGIDFSKSMLSHAKRKNAQHIRSGRVILHEGDCSALPFENDSFDKLCAINTVYFWKQPEVYFSELFRVVRPGGKVAIGFRDHNQMSGLNLSNDIFRSFTKNEIVHLLTHAGFKNAHVKDKEGSPFTSLCGVATKA